MRSGRAGEPSGQAVMPPGLDCRSSENHHIFAEDRHPLFIAQILSIGGRAERVSSAGRDGPSGDAREARPFSLTRVARIACNPCSRSEVEVSGAVTPRQECRGYRGTLVGPTFLSGGIHYGTGMSRLPILFSCPFVSFVVQKFLPPSSTRIVQQRLASDAALAAIGRRNRANDPPASLFFS